MHLHFNNFTLDNFEGPLEFLLCLIQKEEIDLYEISLQNLILQCLQKLSEWKERQLELGAEFVGTMAYFVWLKSRMLLPHSENSMDEVELEEDPHFEIIHHLLDYCKFKQAAKELSQRHAQQVGCFYRGFVPSSAEQKPLGIDHISIEELNLVFKELMRKAEKPKSQIYEESWKVSDKIKAIRSWIGERSLIPLDELFDQHKPRLELIVTFLALLELMKIGFLTVGRQQENSSLVVCKKEEIA